MPDLQLDLALEPKPELIIGPLNGPDGNAFVILGEASRQWRRAGLPRDQFEDIAKEAMSGDYEHLLDTMEKHFTVVGVGLAVDPNWRNHR